jgi:hypothetical protein
LLTWIYICCISQCEWRVAYHTMVAKGRAKSQHTRDFVPHKHPFIAKKLHDPHFYTAWASSSKISTTGANCKINNQLNDWLRFMNSNFHTEQSKVLPHSLIFVPLGFVWELVFGGEDLFFFFRLGTILNVF